MTGNGTTRGHTIPHTMAAASPAAERVQADRDALPEGTTPAEKAEVVRRLIAGHPQRRLALSAQAAVRIARLRHEGKTWREVAMLLGLSPSPVRAIHARAAARI